MRSGGYEVLPGAGFGTINVFSVKEDTCVGCNMCSLVCPVEGCITMHEVDAGRPPMTWNEYQSKLSLGRVAPIQPPRHV
jgi:MinD superfamily P-loop ATPase